MNFIGSPWDETNIAVTALILSGTVQAQQSMNYEDSPMNFKNSEANYNNSSQNYNNSPQNFNNSSSNYNAPNATYDSRGNRTGYEVLSPEGVLNRFDDKGNRTGYSRGR